MDIGKLETTFVCDKPLQYGGISWRQRLGLSPRRWKGERGITAQDVIIYHNKREAARKLVVAQIKKVAGGSSVKEYTDNIPWGEVGKFALKCVIVLAVYFAVQSAISCDSIRWMSRQGSEVAK